MAGGLAGSADKPWRHLAGDRRRADSDRRAPALKICSALPQETRRASYSVLLNSAIAMAINPRPITATIDSDSHSGTGQPPQVMSGASSLLKAGGKLR